MAQGLNALSRRKSTETTPTICGHSFTHDGFGNRINQTLTKGSGPPHSVAIDATAFRHQAWPIPLPYSNVASLNPVQRRDQSPADIEKIFEDNKRTVGIRFFSVVDRTAMSTLSVYFEESVRRGAPLLAQAVRAGRPERRYELRKARITGWSFAPSEQQAQSQTVKPTSKIFVCPSDAGVGRLAEIPRSFWPAREGGIAIETLEFAHEGLQL